MVAEPLSVIDKARELRLKFTPEAEIQNAISFMEQGKIQSVQITGSGVYALYPLNIDGIGKLGVVNIQTGFRLLPEQRPQSMTQSYQPKLLELHSCRSSARMRNVCHTRI